MTPPPTPPTSAERLTELFQERIWLGTKPGQHPPILIGGDYATEGEPDIVIEVTGSEPEDVAKRIRDLWNDAAEFNAPSLAAALAEARQESEKLRAVVERVTEDAGWLGVGKHDTEVFYCEHCDANCAEYDAIQHTTSCLITAARAALEGGRG